MRDDALGFQGLNRTSGSACLEIPITEQALLFSISVIFYGFTSFFTFRFFSKVRSGGQYYQDKLTL